MQTGEVQYEGGLPLKWFSIPQCWRFETTQRGRKREHYQWNMDVVGVPHVNAEIELLAAACDFFKSLGIGPNAVGIKVNSRAVLETLLAKYGIKKQEGEDTFAKACVIIDKLDKVSRERSVSSNTDRHKTFANSRRPTTPSDGDTLSCAVAVWRLVSASAP